MPTKLECVPTQHFLQKSTMLSTTTRCHHLAPAFGATGRQSIFQQLPMLQTSTYVRDGVDYNAAYSKCSVAAQRPDRGNSNVHIALTNQDSLAQCTCGMEKLSWHTTASHHLPLSHCVLASRQLEDLILCKQHGSLVSRGHKLNAASMT